MWIIFHLSGTIYKHERNYNKKNTETSNFLAMHAIFLTVCVMSENIKTQYLYSYVIIGSLIHLSSYICFFVFLNRIVRNI